MKYLNSKAVNIRQTIKSFNRLEQEGAERERLRDYHDPSAVRRFGRRLGRLQKPEVEYAALIKAGIMRVIRKRNHYPLLEVNLGNGWQPFEKAVTKAE